MKIVRYHYTLIDSTNNWSKEHIHEFDRDKMYLVTAEEQSGGRGRFNRQWLSPPRQNIYATFNFFINKVRSDLGNIPQILAISAVECLAELGFEAFIKWPNDLILAEKKVAGILCETLVFEELLGVILGIGLNVNMSEEMLQKIDRPATSLLVEKGVELETESILASLSSNFMKNLELFLREGFTPFYPKYLAELAHHAGEHIRFHDNRQLLEGIFHSLNPDGSLNLLLATKEIKRCVAGEILP